MKPTLNGGGEGGEGGKGWREGGGLERKKEGEGRGRNKRRDVFFFKYIFSFGGKIDVRQMGMSK